MAYNYAILVGYNLLLLYKKKANQILMKRRHGELEEDFSGRQETGFLPYLRFLS